MYLHLTTHSAYSLQEGLAQPADLARAAAEAGMPALGLTDHRLLSGSVEFVTACKTAGVQPVLGLEIDLEPGDFARAFPVPSACTCPAPTAGRCGAGTGGPGTGRYCLH